MLSDPPCSMLQSFSTALAGQFDLWGEKWVIGPGRQRSAWYTTVGPDSGSLQQHSDLDTIDVMDGRRTENVRVLRG
jgi:hypothetical protein